MTLEASELMCLFITEDATDEIVAGICGGEASTIHAINLLDMTKSIAVPTCDYHDGVMNGTVILREET